MHILLHSNSPEKMLGSNKTMQERLFEFGWEYCIHLKPTFFLAITCAGLFAYRLDHSGPWRNISPISLCSKSNLHNIFLLISYFSYVTIKILFDIADHSYILSCWFVLFLFWCSLRHSCIFKVFHSVVVQCTNTLDLAI